VTRFGATAAEARRLKGATVTESERVGDSYRMKFALADGATLEGRVSQADFEALMFAGIPVVTDATLTEPDTDGSAGRATR
jgi:hypothetical protein